jgi:hypothetical protein
MNLLFLFAIFASIAYAQDGACILTNQTLYDPCTDGYQ